MINPDKVLKELSDLWVELARQPEKAQGSGVMRACSMTLVTITDDSDDAVHIGETLACLMREHPSRAIVVRLRDAKEDELSSRVFAQCWMPFGQRRQICCEQIEITASGTNIADVPGVILPLVVPDLPVIVWSRGTRDPRPFSAIAQKTIVDSAGWDGSRLADLPQQGTVGDLAWTRLTRTRELVAQVFQNRYAELREISRIRVVHEGETRSTAVLYLGAWLLNCLEKGGAHPELVWDHSTDGAQTIALDDQLIIISRPDATVEVHINQQVTNSVFPKADDYTLLREELSIPGPDPVYQAALNRAQEFIR